MLLLQQPDLLPAPSQRLSILFLLYDMYKTEPPQNNPYVAFFLQLLVNIWDSPFLDKVKQINKQMISGDLPRNRRIGTFLLSFPNTKLNLSSDSIYTIFFFKLFLVFFFKNNTQNEENTLQYSNLPTLTFSEKLFLSQLLTTPSKDVCKLKYICMF